MQTKQCKFVIALLCAMVFVTQFQATAQKANQDIAGTWTGSYTVDGGPSNELSYTIKKGDNDQWVGSLKFANQDGVQTADFKSLQLVDGKLKAKVAGPDGSVEVTLEGELKGDQMEGTYSVSPAGGSDVVEKGTWKVTRKPPAKAGQ